MEVIIGYSFKCSCCTGLLLADAQGRIPHHRVYLSRAEAAAEAKRYGIEDDLIVMVKVQYEN